MTGEEIMISDISIVMASSGISTTVDYAFSLVIYNTLNGLASNSTSSVYALPAFTRIGDNKAGACEFMSRTIQARRIVYPLAHISAYSSQG